MSDFITTMTTRAMGEIPTVEPLMPSMFLSLPAMPSDYTEDTLSQPQASTFIDDEPDLNFKPLVNPSKLSSTMSKWDENSDLVQSFPLLQVEPHLDGAVIQDELDNISQSVTEIEDYGLKNRRVAEGAEKRNKEVSVIFEGEILPQVNHLQKPLEAVEASVELDLTKSISESELQQTSNEIDFPNLENKETVISKSTDLNSSDNNQPNKDYHQVNSQNDKLTNIIPQVNHLQTPSKAVKASIELDLNKSISESELKQVSKEIEFPNADDMETIISVETPKQDNSETTTNFKNINSERDTLPNIVPQVNHLQTASQSVKADVYFDLSTSISESESDLNYDNTHKELPEQFTNKQNQPTGKAAKIANLEISSVENYNSNNTIGKQQTQTQKTVKPCLKQQTLAPQVNRIETAKFSVQPDIQLDATQLNLQNPLQQQRSINTEIVKAQTEKSTPSQFKNNSQSQTLISPQQQSIRANLPFNSNLVNQQLSTDNEITVIATIGSNPKPSENRNESVSPINDKHSNIEFVEKSEIQSSISRVTPNLTKQKSVISPGEDTVSLLPSPIHTQTDFRRHQAEFQPPPTIEVTIGRIEVRGIQPEPSTNTQRRKSTKKSPGLSLSDYLKQRDGK